MSFDIFWDKLDKQVAQKVQDIINEQFRTSNNKPSFIGDIEISEFDFGTVPPSIEIIDVTDPFPEFYLPDNTVVDVDAKSDLSESGGNVNGVGSGVRNGNGGIGGGIGVERVRTRENDQTQYEPSNSEGEEVPLKQDTDAQIHIELSYKGNMKMVICTELYMNYPSLMFMSLPVRLTITGFEFSATAVVAYLRNRVNFCFLEPKNPEESHLKEVYIESEIGDKEKQVLKNVGKLEKFIIDQLRKIIDEDFVFPCYHSIEL
ncbi:hypothetical protein C1646_649331 [Rhizophagus diaphanus]|nr:hypothetical protein C1646_649331 [Rhizophagus diaphanus] [Rhizophagus sp. MUCL 43196]